MTGKNSGKHGVFEFLEYHHDPLKPRVNSSRSIQCELVWEIAARHGKTTVAGGVPMSYPHRKVPGFFLGDFLSPSDAPDFASDPQIFAELQREVGRYRPWCTVVHDGGNEVETLQVLTAFLNQHLRTVEFLMQRCDWDLFMFDLMATDRAQHELWHVWDTSHHVAAGREAELAALRPKFLDFWAKLDEGIGRIADRLPADTTLILISDHGFGPIDWFVNFNVWLLDRGDLALKNSLYVKQKQWFYRRGVTPQWFYGQMAKWGQAKQRVSRFRGKQDDWVERIARAAFLSRNHIDWSRTRAYSQGNFGQIFINQRGRQPHGCVAPEDAPGLIRDLKAALLEIPNPITGEPLIEHVYERDELYHGPHEHLGPDLTVVPRDWRFRTIGLHDFTTNKLISRSFGPTGDHRMEGVFVAVGPGIQPGARLDRGTLFDITPTVLSLLGVPLPSDLDGRVLKEVLDPSIADASDRLAHAQTEPETSDFDRASAGSDASDYTEEEEAVIQRRLEDLGYL